MRYNNEIENKHKKGSVYIIHKAQFHCMYKYTCINSDYCIMILTFSFATFVERHLLIRRWIFLRDLETWENRLPRDLQWPPARNGTWAIAREMISPVIYTNTLLASSVSSRLERGTDSSSLPNIYFGLIWYDTDIYLHTSENS